MAIPTFVAGSTFVSSTGAITPALPAGIATDDILVLFLETHQETATIPTPNGGTWTQTPSSPQGNGGGGSNSSSRVTVFWSRYNGTQGDPTTNDPGDHISGRMQAYRGVKTTDANPFNVSSGAGGSAAVSVPGATTTIDDCFVLMCITSEDDGDTFSFPFTNASLANLVGRGNNTHTAGDEGHIARSEGDIATAGAYGATTTTLAPSGQAWGGITLALEPPVGTGYESNFTLLGVGA